MPAMAGLAAVVLTGTAVVMMSSSASVELAQKHHSLANNYRSSDAARAELNEYFDSQAVATRKHGISSKQAMSQLNAIFPTAGDAKIKQIRAKQQKTVMQDLHYSSSAAQDDLDSYFDSMDSSPKKHAHKDHHFKAESTDKARDDMDSYWDSLTESEHHEWHHAKKSSSSKPTAEMVAQAKKLALEEYKKDHPDFAKKLDQVHIDWMKTHDGIPTTVSEKKKYTNLIKEVEQGVDLPITKHLKAIMDGKEDAKTGMKAQAADSNPRKLALQKFLDSNPDVKAKMVKAKKEFFEEYGHPPNPKSKHEMQKYHDIMKKAVGKIDISIDKELGTKKAKGADSSDKVAELKKFEKENPMVQAKIQKVHKLWASKHTAPPKTPAEEAEYGELMKQYVVPAVATMTDAAQDEAAGKK
mmetsp:Transcript_133433/g.198358  ORF Transcript_133433/g.198358 Transcript_133433/m.198358 type:complete len:411 (+) Transcript_133433:2-1234(+)